MATINDSWDLTTPAGGDAISGGDDKIREFKRAVEERLKNMGAKWPSGTDAKSGMLRVSADNYVGNEFAVYASDESTKQLRITDSAIELNDATTIEGNTALDEANHKRLVVFSGSVLLETGLSFAEAYFEIPSLYDGTIKAVSASIRPHPTAASSFDNADFLAYNDGSLMVTSSNFSGDPLTHVETSLSNDTFTSGSVCRVEFRLFESDEFTGSSPGTDVICHVMYVCELDW